MRGFLFLPILIFQLITTSCEPQKGVSVQNQNPAAATAKPQQNIVYLFFDIEKNPDGTETVRHTDTKITEGILKNATIDNKPSVPGNLFISILGKNGEVVEERIIEDPLNPLLEVYAEEGLSKNKLQLTKGQFSVRFNQKGDIAAVKVEKITPNSKNALITVKL